METKVCNGPICKGKDLPIDNFGKSGKYRKSQCKLCYAVSMRKGDIAMAQKCRWLQDVMLKWTPPRVRA